MRTCTKCGVAQPLSAFATRRTERGTLQSWCRMCHRAAAALRYARQTPEALSEKRRRERDRNLRLRRVLWELLGTMHCIDCGESDILVLEFDHLSEKRGNIADLVVRWPWAAVESEIARCEVRCANCHRRRTSQRRTAGGTETASGPLRVRRRNPGVTDGSRPATLLGPADATDLVSDGVQCGRCGLTKSATAFAWHSTERGIRQTWCRECHNAQKRVHYSEHRASEKARTRRRQLATVAANAPRLLEFLEQHPCVDCGECDAAVLDFDHLRDKRNNVTTMLWSGLRWSAIEDEIAKCEVRCANCHRRRTARQRGYDQRKLGLAEDRSLYGEAGGTRTPGPHVRSVVLYPLSYSLSRANSSPDATS